MGVIEVRRDGEVICVCKDESCLYSADVMKDMKADVMKDMKANGYKFYKDGKIYRPEKN